MIKKIFSIKEKTEIFRAISLVEQNDTLGQNGYWLSKIKKKLLGDVEAFQKMIEPERLRIVEIQKANQAKAQLGWEIENIKLDQQFDAYRLSEAEKIDQADKEPIELKTFDYTDFMAKDDFEKMAFYQEDGQQKSFLAKYKKGDSLVPGIFFELMGDLISD